MKPQIEEQLNQAPQQQQDLTPDEAMANLAFATNLQEQLLPKAQEAPVEGEISPETAPEQPQMEEVEETPEPQEQAPEIDLNAELDNIRSELKDTIKEEMDSFKKILKDALNN